MSFEREVKFGMIADLHADFMPHARKRLEDFLRVCREEDVDFIIQLGDFCFPPESGSGSEVERENALMVEMFGNFEKPSFHVLGNHDCDYCTKERVLDYWGERRGPYYSFDWGRFHFVVLDLNYYQRGGEYVSYERGNYSSDPAREKSKPPYLPDAEAKWLEKDLAGTKLKSVIFSHQSLRFGGIRSVGNQKRASSILEKAPAGVAVSFNGHEHMDNAVRQNGIWYMNVNSASYMWLGEEFVCPERYGREMDEKFTRIKYTAPYRDAVFTVVGLAQDGARIRGVYSEFVGPSPDSLGVYDEGSRFLREHTLSRTTASIEKRFLPFENAAGE